ncbi:unnamed protein product [Anisakis simplex]|uniref:Solute carrier family 35 member F6 (inferred by orthology to a human protein) n=1 Tax=Anisakis simplex TaxID=6269 RepID=A0A0M3K574_ANISI|nr:unnamed protein product [Anisakis simplex]
MDDDQRSHAIFAVFLAVLMVTTGSLNTIAAKWADSIKVDGKLFNHPFVQAICMFIGEFSCLAVYFIVFWIRRRNWRKRELLGAEGRVMELDVRGEPTLPDFNVFLFAAPACCDIIGTSLMYIGLNLTQASSYQMLRGNTLNVQKTCHFIEICNNTRLVFHDTMDSNFNSPSFSTENLR